MCRLDVGLDEGIRILHVGMDVAMHALHMGIDVSMHTLHVGLAPARTCMPIKAGKIRQ